jgi:hypothetical protein
VLVGQLQDLLLLVLRQLAPPVAHLRWRADSSGSSGSGRSSSSSSSSSRAPSNNSVCGCRACKAACARSFATPPPPSKPASRLLLPQGATHTTCTAACVAGRVAAAVRPQLAHTRTRTRMCSSV